VCGRELEQSAEELRRGSCKGIASKMGAVHKELTSYIDHASEPGSKTHTQGGHMFIEAVEGQKTRNAAPHALLLLLAPKESIL
jgi:hypothetical protein